MCWETKGLLGDRDEVGALTLSVASEKARDGSLQDSK